MPHDINGKVVAVGDTVIIRAKVLNVNMGEEYCNVTVETEQPMFPGTNKSQITLNAKQVEKTAE